MLWRHLKQYRTGESSQIIDIFQNQIAVNNICHSEAKRCMANSRIIILPL